MEIRLKPEQYDKVLQNMKLVHYLLKKVKVSPSDYDDLVQIGMIGLMKAVATFDETRKIQFATYASRCINNEINMYFRKNKKHLGNISLSDPIYQGKNGEELVLEDMVADPLSLESIEKVEKTEMIERAVSIILNYFSIREKAILLFSIGGVNQKNIAGHFNLSQSYISRLEKRLYEFVKQLVNNKNKFQKEVFSVALEHKKIRITFSTTDIVDFKKSFANFLLKTSEYEKLQNFKIICENGRVVMYLLAEPDSFALIAEILLELENFSMEFEEKQYCGENKKPVVEEVKSVSKVDIQKNVEQQIVEEPENGEHQKAEMPDEPKEDVDVGGQTKISSTQVREYMLTLKEFTVKQLKLKFPTAPQSSIANAIYLAKQKGTIVGIGKGKYIVVSK